MADVHGFLLHSLFDIWKPFDSWTALKVVSISRRKFAPGPPPSPNHQLQAYKLRNDTKEGLHRLSAGDIPPEIYLQSALTAFQKDKELKPSQFAENIDKTLSEKGITNNQVAAAQTLPGSGDVKVTAANPVEAAILKANEE
ncbi:MAG: hypothetical protein L6R42_009804 [Xanthoria sp. 1 TBL-2021]|nr:MAG: hypothetical protein L6R42_009804 [Xanthoria sp. 1 TBL-2021]